MVLQSSLVSVLLLFLTACNSEKMDKQDYTRADVEKALKDASQYKRDGKYENALERHVWYHKNALKYAPAQYGVRLSFALGDWVELGKVFPKALDALRATRDEELSTYLADPSNELKYLDVMSINFAIEDWSAAKALFYQGQKHGIKSDSNQLYLDKILAHGDVQWASDIIGDPIEAVEQIRLEREGLVMWVKSQKKLQSMQTDFDRLYISKLLSIIKAVDKSKGRKQAHKIQEEALKVIDTPLLRDALKP